MPKFCPKEDIVEAVQFDGHNWSEVKWLAGSKVHSDAKQLIRDYNGGLFDVLPGTWIVKDSDNNVFCRDNVKFHREYSNYVRVWFEEPDVARAHEDYAHEAYAAMCGAYAIERNAVADSHIKPNIACIREALDFIERGYRDSSLSIKTHETLREAIGKLIDIAEGLAIIGTVRHLLPRAAGEEETDG